MYWFKKYFSQPYAHVRALIEVAIVSLFSLLPYSVTAFVRVARTTSGSEFNFGELFARGQIYLLAYAMFGTIFWLAFVRSDRPRHDARIFLGVLAVILVIPIIGFTGVDPTFSTVINRDVITWGYGFYFAFLAIYYLLIFYSDIVPPDPQDIFERGTRDLDRDYDRFAHEQQD
ncbi:hypothetical protein NCF85_04265 [Qipengyuania citrea]|uniref:DUF805 domain-containing protein n=1 Tax=Qipengyuania citrea TaxID=225971 RepID=A0ABY4U8X4_9SPHN|nr:hypothetical protein [Qipengyuania citrea]USA62206.1 hypothetical protein NCF85_04265 [Qipengyuania citrea]